LNSSRISIDKSEVKRQPKTLPGGVRTRCHYRIDINTSPPSIRETSWRLKIHGLVAKPLEWTLADLRTRPAMHQFITLSCISNTVRGDLTGTTRWSGVSLQQLLPDLGLQPNATHLKIHSADGFFEVVALEARRHPGGRPRHADLRLGWSSTPRKSRFPVADLYPRPLWHETTQVMNWMRGGAMAEKDLRGKSEL
jgi:hypothetical protein